MSPLSAWRCIIPVPAAAGSLLIGTVLALSPPPAAGWVSVGLSSVRARSFDNEPIDGFLPETGDRFGSALAAGDFNGDGAEDLATGIPYDDGPSDLPLVDAGAVVVRWGSPVKGLTVSPAPALLSLYAPGGQTNAHALDHFGYALAAGDFNGDGRDDLAVGIPGFGLTGCRGAVQIHYGLAGGIQLAGEHLLSPGDGNIPNLPGNQCEFFGQALAAGDFDGDGYDDLAIGAPQTFIFPATPGGGAVVVLHGGIGGLLPYSGYLISQSDPQVPDDSEDPDDFGFALAAGNFNGDVRCNIDGICRPLDDLAMSAPGEDGEGAVMAMFGSDFGLIFANSVYFGQFDLGGSGGEAGDRFGASLATGDFDADGYADLVIGAPLEDLGAANSLADVGEITVLYGSNAGAPNWFNLGRTGHWRQSNIYGLPAADQAGDHFGAALASGDFDHDGADDLAVGHPGEDVGGSNRGAVTILMGAAGTGLLSRWRVLATETGDLPGTIQSDQDLGAALAAGDFDGDGHSDLAIGAPYRDVSGTGADVGMEWVTYGSIFSDGFYYGNSGDWSSESP